MEDRRVLLAAIFDGLSEAGLSDERAAVVSAKLLRQVTPRLQEYQVQYQELRTIAVQLLGGWPVSKRSPALDEARRYMRHHCARCGRAAAHSTGHAESLCEHCA